MVLLTLGLMDDDAAFQKALKWVEGQIARVERGPRFGDDGAMRFAAMDAQEAAEAVLAKYGSRPAIHRMLGRIYHALGEYAEASAAFELGGQPAQANRSREFGQVKSLFEANHPKRVVASMARIGEGGKVRWVIAHGDRHSDTDDIITPHVNVRVTIRESGANVFTSANLKRPEWDESEFNEANLYVRDLNGDGRSEVVFIGVFYGASWTPSVLNVLSQSGAKWQTSRTIATHDPLWIDDLDGNGTIEVGGVNVIGVTLSHAAQPRWLEIYDWAPASGLVRSDSKYRNRYRDLRKEIDELLKENKHDWELLAYRGRIARIFGNRSEAANWEGRAQAALAAERRRDFELPASLGVYIRKVVRQDEVGDSPRL
jgi:hypothetical protein